MIIKAKDIIEFIYEEKKFFDGDTTVLCPSCKKEIKIIEFIESEVPCETCGEHYAVQCPKCKKDFDSTLCNDIFQIA